MTNQTNSFFSMSQTDKPSETYSMDEVLALVGVSNINELPPNLQLEANKLQGTKKGNFGTDFANAFVSTAKTELPKWQAQQQEVADSAQFAEQQAQQIADERASMQAAQDAQALARQEAYQGQLAQQQQQFGDYRQGLQDQYSPYIQQGQASQGQLNALMGQGGLDAQQAAMANFKESPYQQYVRAQTEKATLRNAATTGGLGGGNVQKALQDRSQALSGQFLGQHMDRLQGQANMGQNAQNSMAQFGGAAFGQGQGIQGNIFGQGQGIQGDIYDRGQLLGQNAWQFGQGLTGGARTNEQGLNLYGGDIQASGGQFFDQAYAQNKAQPNSGFMNEIGNAAQIANLGSDIYGMFQGKPKPTSSGSGYWNLNYGSK